jgi:hypothetical protein
MGDLVFLINCAQGPTFNPNKVFGAPTPKTLGEKKGGQDILTPVPRRSSQHAKNLGARTPIIGVGFHSCVLYATSPELTFHRSFTSCRIYLGQQLTCGKDLSSSFPHHSLFVPGMCFSFSLSVYDVEVSDAINPFHITHCLSQFVSSIGSRMTKNQ